MIVDPLDTMLIGATAGVALCTIALRKRDREARSNIGELHLAASIALFFAAILAFVKLGLGAVFEQPLADMRSIDTSKPVGALLIPAGWACAAAGIELVVVVGWLVLHGRRDAANRLGEP